MSELLLMEAVAQVRSLTRSFEQGGVRIDVLRGVDLDIAPGEIVALLGPSGSGKSTMLQAIGLLEGGFGGRIVIAGTDATQLDGDARTTLRRDHIGFVYQFHHLLPDFTAIENVILPQLVADVRHADAEDRAIDLLEALGLGKRLDHRPSQLSGGEQQRVAVARALGQQARAGAGGRAHRQPRRSHRGQGFRRIRQAGARGGQRRPGRHPQRAARLPDGPGGAAA